MDQTSPPATIGEPWAPLVVCQNAAGGEAAVGVTARSPSLQGTKTVPLRSADPPSGSLPQKLAADCT